MKKDVLKRFITKIFIGACVLAVPCSGMAADVAEGDMCAKEMLLSYFPSPIVKETLKRFNVPQEKWDGILKSLSNKDKEVVKLVEQKAAEMSPNPLKDPQQRQAAVKLFRDTLLQVFSDALKENNMTDTSKYQAMLDDIQQQKAKQFAMCMDRQKQKAEALDKAATEDMSDEAGNEKSNDNDNDNDNEEDENDNDDDDDMTDEDDDMTDDNDMDEEEEEPAKTNPNAAQAPKKKQ